MYLWGWLHGQEVQEINQLWERQIGRKEEEGEEEEEEEEEERGKKERKAPE